MIELIKALTEVKKSLEPVQKDRKGQIFKTGPSVSWSSLENIQEVVTPLLAQNGFSIWFPKNTKKLTKEMLAHLQEFKG